MSKRVDQLIEELVKSHKTQHGNACWASRLDGEAAETLAGLRKVEASGVKLNRGAIQDLLKREFDIVISESALVSHLKGRCRCD